MPKVWQRGYLQLIGLLIGAALLSSSLARAESELRLGIIGTDSSHAVEFTRILNDAAAADHVQGAHVVAAYRGGNPTLPLSRNRIEAFTADLTNRWKIPFVDTIRNLCPKIDGVLLLSVDPAKRQPEFEAAAACGKPIFVDKPFGPTLQAAMEMAQFADRHKIRWFSSSALRFGAAQQVGTNDIRGADAWGPGALGDDYALDLSWYGIHSIEMLYAVLGPGVKTVSRIHTADSDIITGVWADGRVGTVHLLRPNLSFGIVAFHSQGRAEVRDNVPIAYAPLLEEVVRFMRGGRSPVDARETLEIFAFMDAAQRSMQQHGSAMRLSQPANRPNSNNPSLEQQHVR